MDPVKNALNTSRLGSCRGAALSAGCNIGTASAVAGPLLDSTTVTLAIAVVRTAKATICASQRAVKLHAHTTTRYAK